MKLSEQLEYLFYRKLCNQPDKPIFGSMKFACWLYNFTGRIAGFFHRMHCDRCREKYKLRRKQKPSRTY